VPGARAHGGIKDFSDVGQIGGAPGLLRLQSADIIKAAQEVLKKNKAWLAVNGPDRKACKRLHANNGNPGISGGQPHDRLINPAEKKEVAGTAFLCGAVPGPVRLQARRLSPWIFPVQPYWAWVEEFGLLIVSPALANFTRSTLTKAEFYNGQNRPGPCLLDAAAALSLIWPWQTALAESIPLYLFAGRRRCAMPPCCGASSGCLPDRALADGLRGDCLRGALLLTFSDLLYAYGYPLLPSPISPSACSSISCWSSWSTGLPELYLIMARMFVVFLLTVFGTAAFFLSIRLFGKACTRRSPRSDGGFFNSYFCRSLKIILKKIFSRLFSGEGKEILTSLYTVDGEAEKQKSVLLEEMGTVLATRSATRSVPSKGGPALRSEAEDPRGESSWR